MCCFRVIRRKKITKKVKRRIFFLYLYILVDRITEELTDEAVEGETHPSELPSLGWRRGGSGGGGEGGVGKGGGGVGKG